ncbi:hypothetical protein ABH922_001789 [Rhodococcus sp. 27YEA15]|uniref:hypothetical protein n=1 Tax=Rhodococcus sp. 27YEA15 TaxID=3156259 RepID=UPI003C7A2B51
MTGDGMTHPDDNDTAATAFLLGVRAGFEAATVGQLRDAALTAALLEVQINAVAAWRRTDGGRTPPPLPPGAPAVGGTDND